MTAQTPIQFETAKVRPRHDGWTAEKQIRFIEALAATACVDEACRRVGMSDTSAYALRRKPSGTAFRKAWDAALDCAIHRIEQRAIDRALNGVPRPIFRNGEQVGEWRYYDERLTMFFLRSRRPARYGKWIEKMLAPEDADYLPYEDDGVALECGVTAIEFTAPEEHGNPVDEWEEGASE